MSEQVKLSKHWICVFSRSMAGWMDGWIGNGLSHQTG